MLYCIAATNQSDWHEFGISGDYESCYAYMGTEYTTYPTFVYVGF